MLLMKGAFQIIRIDPSDFTFFHVKLSSSLRNNVSYSNRDL